jgi:hypothetical protein
MMNEDNKREKGQVEGFPKRLKQHPSFKFMLFSKVVIRLVDSGKGAFEMARRACFGRPRRGPGPPEKLFIALRAVSPSVED